MQPNQRIEIQLVDDAGRCVRLGNILLGITLFAGGHLRYAFDLRPTSAMGQTVTDFNELDTRRLHNALFSLMDYNTPLTTCDPTVEISIDTELGLQKRLQTINEWNLWTIPTWVVKWPANGCLSAVSPKSVTLEGPLTHVDVAVRLPSESSRQ